MKKLFVIVFLASLLTCSLMLNTGAVGHYVNNNTQLAEYEIINPPPA